MHTQRIIQRDILAMCFKLGHNLQSITTYSRASTSQGDLMAHLSRIGSQKPNGPVTDLVLKKKNLGWENHGAQGKALNSSVSPGDSQRTVSYERDGSKLPEDLIYNWVPQIL